MAECYSSGMSVDNASMMRSPWLSAVGVIALLAIGVFGVVSLMLVKDRLRVEVSLDAPEPDSLALVRDDFKVLQADFVALTQALEQQAGTAAAHWSGQFEQRAEADRGLAAVVAGFDARLKEQGQRLQALLDLQSASRSPNPAVVPGTSPNPVPVAPVEPTVLLDVESTPDPQPTKTVLLEPGPPAPKGFLGFRLPSRSYRFDQHQSYEILPDLSRVGFDAKSTLHDFSGVTTKIRGSFHANLADPAASFTGTIACDAAALDSGVEGRDEAMRDHLVVGDHPEISFAAQSFVADGPGVDLAKMSLHGTVTGMMRIRGVDKQIAMPVIIRVDGSRRVCIEGQAKVHLPDFGVPVPDKVVIRMQPEVDIWIALRARPAGGGSDAK